MEQIKKLTPDYLKSLITSEEYQRFGKTVTVCVLHLTNGFAVVGKSACIDESKFDETIGRRVAYDNAFDQLWELEGYAVCKSNQQVADGHG